MTLRVLTVPMAKSNAEADLEDQLHVANTQVDQLELENKRLVDQLREVIRMNTHWQRYDSQREEYVMKLTKTNQDLQDKFSNLQRQVTKQNKHLRMEVMQPQIAAEGVGIASLRLEDGERETEEYLRKQHARQQADEPFTFRRKDEEDEEFRALTDRVAKLKARICELESELSAKQKESEEKIALLREQVNICVEDFKQERKDRERCHEENVRLQKRLAQAEADLRANEEQVSRCYVII